MVHAEKGKKVTEVFVVNHQHKARQNQVDENVESGWVCVYHILRSNQTPTRGRNW